MALMTRVQTYDDTWQCQLALLVNSVLIAGEIKEFYPFNKRTKLILFFKYIFYFQPLDYT